MIQLTKYDTFSPRKLQTGLVHQMTRRKWNVTERKITNKYLTTNLRLVQEGNNTLIHVNLYLFLEFYKQLSKFQKSSSLEVNIDKSPSFNVDENVHES